MIIYDYYYDKLPSTKKMTFHLFVNPKNVTSAIMKTKRCTLMNVIHV